MSKIMKEICYYCGGASSGREHIPPRSFFPDSQKENLFTVPSCEIHNNSKSKDDEYVKIVLTTSANLMLRDDLLPIINKSNRALNKNPKLESTVYESPEPAIVMLPNGELLESKSHKIDLERFYSFFDCLGRGLYFHRKNRVWRGKVSIAPHFFLSDTADEIDLKQNRELLALFDKNGSHGSNKDIFYYTFVTVADENDGHIVFYVLCICLFDEFKISILLRPEDN